MNITTEQIEALKILGNYWQTSDGSKRRIYFNDLAQYIGLDCGFYGTGNVSSATLNGEKISNTKATAMLSQFNSGKLWFDLSDDKFHALGIEVDTLRKIAAVIRAKAGIEQ